MRVIKENLIKCERALVPTGISIAPYVINPYRGCGFGCVYCYSQKNKCFQKREDRWGEFVDIKIDFLEVLGRELKNIRPGKVLLGSTTEVYQPVEEKYFLTKGVIELLNKYSIPMTILTRSNLILKDIETLYNAKVCFTINTSTRALEPYSPSLEERIYTIKLLRGRGIYTYVHIGPIFPGLTDIERIMALCYGITDRLDFESFNYWMSPIENIDPILTRKDIFNSEETYNNYWDNLKDEIIKLNIKYDYRVNFHFHPYKSYWLDKPPPLSPHPNPLPTGERVRVRGEG